jgi:acyl carrier protein
MVDVMAGTVLHRIAALNGHHDPGASQSADAGHPNDLQITENELWLLSYYRESELAGALLMGRLARETDDDDLRVRLTEHCAEEARHAWAWTETILKVGGTPRRVSETYQSRYHAAVGNPSNLLEVLALTQIFERRVVRHFKAHLMWPGTHPEVLKTLQQLIDEEVGHIRWVKDRLDDYAAVNGETVVKEMLDRFQRIDEQVYNELGKYRDCVEQLVGPKRASSDSIGDRLRRVAADSLGREPSEIRLDASLVEMGVDSLDLVVFMMAVEDEFEVEFRREDQKKMRTLGDVAANIAKSGIGAQIEN